MQLAFQNMEAWQASFSLGESIVPTKPQGTNIAKVQTSYVVHSLDRGTQYRLPSTTLHIMGIPQKVHRILGHPPPCRTRRL